VDLSVLAVADEVSSGLYDHFTPSQWPGVDIIVSCGDVPPDYLDYLGGRLNAPVFFVRGNHDGTYSRDAYYGSENLHGRTTSYRGVRIAGFEGSMRYNDRDVQYTEREMRSLVKRAELRSLVQGVPQIVVTHAPIAGVHDGTDLAHRGFQCFRRLIEAWKPDYFVHGHTHWHYGRECVTGVHGSSVINAFPYALFRVKPGTPRRPAIRTVGSGIWGR
jgi:uncharacterized protein